MKQQIIKHLFDRYFILRNRIRVLEILYNDNDYPKSMRANRLLIATTKKYNKIKKLLHQ
jgi:hypothetical protein